MCSHENRITHPATRDIWECADCGYAPPQRGHDGLTDEERIQQMLQPPARDWKDERIDTLNALLRVEKDYVAGLQRTLCDAERALAQARAENARLREDNDELNDALNRIGEKEFANSGYNLPQMVRVIAENYELKAQLAAHEKQVSIIRPGVTYDIECGATYVYLQPERQGEQNAVHECLEGTVDLDSDGRLYGIELFDLSQESAERLTAARTKSIQPGAMGAPSKKFATFF